MSFEWDHLATTLGYKEGQKSIGMIAQDMQKVYPQLVGTVKTTNGQEYLTIDYVKFTAVLLQSVKELKAEVDELKKEVKMLKEQK